jgi:hypothetical protein
LTRNLFRSFLHYDSRRRFQVVVHGRLNVLHQVLRGVREKGGVLEDNNSGCFLLLELQLAVRRETNQCQSE